jgi:hypothetical protein
MHPKLVTIIWRQAKVIGKIDAFRPGKLNEIGIFKIILKISNKGCSIDNEIYSNCQV